MEAAALRSDLPMSRQVSTETKDRLRWHAGLNSAAQTAVPSISYCTGSEGSVAALDEALPDLLVTLARLNHELNGEIPSESTDSATEISRDLVYAIAEVIRLLRDAADKPPGQSDARSFERAAWLIETTWAAALAGDIDDLPQHVNREHAARQL
jgi:hypothetical protein